MITILKLVELKVGKKESYGEDDFRQAGFAMHGGCFGCHASLGAYNAYPTTTGFWGCAECAEGLGFETAEEFEAWQKEQEEANDPLKMQCPDCGLRFKLHVKHTPTDGYLCPPPEAGAALNVIVDQLDHAGTPFSIERASMHDDIIWLRIRQRPRQPTQDLAFDLDGGLRNYYGPGDRIVPSV